jgi:hypothetical protein
LGLRSEEEFLAALQAKFDGLLGRFAYWGSSLLAKRQRIFESTRMDMA